MPAAAVESFIARWQSAGGSERANYQLFITELCERLGLPKPDPARAEAAENAYVFERRAIFGRARLVAVNAQRRAEEAQGLIRWRRPEIQNL